MASSKRVIGVKTQATSTGKAKLAPAVAATTAKIAKTAKTKNTVSSAKPTVISEKKIVSTAKLAAEKGQGAKKTPLKPSPVKSNPTKVTPQKSSTEKSSAEHLSLKKSNSKETGVAKPDRKKLASAKDLTPTKTLKQKKDKLVRDSFTMPESEYGVLSEVKKLCLSKGVEVKKSQLLRIGLALLKTLDVKELQAQLANLPALKAGRPKLDK